MHPSQVPHQQAKRPDARQIHQYRLRQITQEAREASNQTSRLLSLPGELRNLIFSFLIPNNNFNTDHTPRFGITGIKPKTTHTAVPFATHNRRRHYFLQRRVCRQARYEATKYFYGWNTFVIANGSKYWIKDLPPEALVCLSRIILFQPWPYESNSWRTFGRGRHFQPRLTFKGADIVLFELENGTNTAVKVLRTANLGDCTCQTLPGTSCRFCRDQRRQTDYEEVLQVIRDAVSKGMSKKKLLKIMPTFRRCIE